MAYTASPLPDGAKGGWLIVFSDNTKAREEQLRIEREMEALSWVGRIRDALDRDGLVLHAQPIVDIRTGIAVQHELLIRMIGPDGSIIPPGRFLPVAERFGLIRDVDRWVAKQAFALAAAGHIPSSSTSRRSRSRIAAFPRGSSRRYGPPGPTPR